MGESRRSREGEEQDPHKGEVAKRREEDTKRNVISL